MHPSRILSIYLLLFLAVAALITVHPIFLAFPYTLLAATAIIVALFWSQKQIRYLALIVLVIFLTLLRVGVTTPRDNPDWWGSRQGEKITAQVIVVSEPEIVGNNQIFLVESLSGRPSGRIRVSTGQFPQYHYDSSLQVTGELKPYVSNGYVKVNQIEGRLSYPGIELLPEKYRPPGLRGWYMYARGRLIYIKDGLVEMSGKVLPEPAAGLLSGILFGTKSELSDALMEILIITGTVHIIALSGYNITIVAKGSQYLVRGLNRNLAFWLPIFGITVFVFATGLSASVIRAAIMGAILILASRLGRQPDSLNAILVASALMVLVNPYILLFDIGFQLSFAAVLGIIYLTPLLDRPFRRLGPIFGPVLAGTVAAQLLSWPIIAYYFGRVSLISLLANALILPIIPLVMLLGFVVLILGFLWLPLARVSAAVVWFMLEYMLKVIDFCSRVRGASLGFISVGISFLIGYYFFVFMAGKILAIRLKGDYEFQKS